LEAAANEAIISLGEKVEKVDSEWMATFFNEKSGKKKMSEKSKMKYIENDFKDYYVIDNNYEGETLHRSIDVKDHEALKKMKNNNDLQQRSFQNQQLNIESLQRRVQENLPEVQQEDK
jgi:hypothetical protein